MSKTSLNYGKSTIEVIADSFQPCGGLRFVPLLRRAVDASCALKILFLRRDTPGGIVKSGGDLDNRKKVLFDALRMPESCDELPKELHSGENPFFCLVESDDLITEVGVVTDRLLIPKRAQEKIHDVVLLIQVKTSIGVAQSSLLTMKEWY